MDMDHDKYRRVRLSPSHSLSICHSKYDKIEDHTQCQIVSILAAPHNSHHMGNRRLVLVTIKAKDRP